jgi:hypothetical protein
MAPPNLLFNGYQDSFPGEKWLGCEVNHCPPSMAKVKNEWNNISTPPVCLPGMDREDFTSYLTCQRRTGENEPSSLIMYSAFGKSLCTWATIRRFGCQYRSTLDELKTAITAYIRNISKADLQKVFVNKIKLVQACIDGHGHHFQHLL